MIIDLIVQLIIAILNNRNCYTHAFKLGNRKSWYNTQPGSISGSYKKGDKRNYHCPIIINRVLDDQKSNTFYQPDCKPCPKNYYQVGLAVDPDRDYHFYRKDGPRSWSHKPGRKKVRYTSKDPRLMKRKHGKYTYSDWCGCFCTQ